MKSKNLGILTVERKKIYIEGMREDGKRRLNEIRVSIAQTDRRESVVANYICNPNRNTKQLCMSALIDKYLALALLDDEEATEVEIIEAGIESICQFRAAIDEVSKKLAMRGYDLPVNSVFDVGSIAKPKAKSEKKPAKPKTPPKSKVVEDDDEDWAEDDPRWNEGYDGFQLPPAMIIDLTD